VDEFAGGVDGGLNIGAVDGQPVEGLRELELGEAGGITALTPQLE
jgi:hypothetical protein